MESRLFPVSDITNVIFTLFTVVEQMLMMLFWDRFIGHVDIVKMRNENGREKWVLGVLGTLNYFFSHFF